MNIQSEFTSLSLAELERKCHKLHKEKVSLESKRKACENELQQIQQKRRNLRNETQNIIERLVTLLLPKLSEPHFQELFRLFQNDENFQASLKNARNSVHVSFWQKLINFIFRRNHTAQTLEQLRIALRDVLWRIKNTPVAAIAHKKEFGDLINRKSQFTNFEKSAVEQEGKANQFIKSFNELLAKSNACQNEIKRRKNVQTGSFDDYDYQNKSPVFNSDERDYDDVDINSANEYLTTDNQYQENTTTYETNSTTEASASWGGFEGGGGGFDGGGAGGSWENYS